MKKIADNFLWRLLLSRSDFQTVEIGLIIKAAPNLEKALAEVDPGNTEKRTELLKEYYKPSMDKISTYFTEHKNAYSANYEYGSFFAKVTTNQVFELAKEDCVLAIIEHYEK